MKITGERIKNEIRRLDKSLSGESQTFKDAAVLLASSIAGPNTDAIAKLLKMPRSEVRAIGRRARAHGLWVGGKVNASDWYHKKEGGIAFWLDVLVLQGMMRRVGTTKKRRSA